MKLNRNKLQEATMIILYDVLTFLKIEEEINVETLLSNYFEIEYAEVDIFVKQVVIKFLSNKDILIEQLQANMPNWKFDRLNRLAQAILLLASTHYLYVEKVDKKIVINNAIRLAKRYLLDNDYRLINAVLDATL